MIIPHYRPNMTVLEKLMSLPFDKIPKADRWGDVGEEVTHGISLYHFGITRLPVPNDTLTDDVHTPPGFRRDLFGVNITYRHIYTFMEIDIHKIVPSQQYVCRKRIIELYKNPTLAARPIRATKFGMYPWIVDGHHRMALQLVRRHLKRKTIYSRLSIPQEGM